jgi:undecaprenyl phosphate N,N'-diacetylbacillosamine 1-phosphate transferase
VYKRYLKPGCDYAAALLMLILLSWLLASIFLLYFLLRYRNIIFSQMRIGLHERPFRLFKFRTLNQSVFLSPAERQFWLGKVMRRSSLDELPQLFNILRGDMSFVGPRPLPIEYLNRFSPNERRRHDVKPGITGLAQVNGRTEITWQQKFRYDLEYTENLSFLLDLKIILKTCILLMSFKKDNSLVEEPFKGTQ